MGDRTKQKVAVLTDSTADIPEALLEKYAIHVIPLMVIMGENTWLDGVDIDPPTLYEKLLATTDFPTTSQPNVDSFQKHFLELSQEYEEIVAILVSDDLSGTIASAKGAKSNLPDIPIKIIDSRGVSMMMGFSVLEAAKVALAGGDMQEVTKKASEVIAKSHVYFIVDTFEYLHQGGRIGGAKKLLGSALNIKPILEISGGIVKPAAQVRTRRKALNKVYELLEDQIPKGSKSHLAVVNVAASDEAAKFKHELTTRFQPVEVFDVECTPVIGAHVGPGTVGVAFYVE